MRARRLGCDLSLPRLAVMALPWQPERRSDVARIEAIERFEREVGRALPGVLFDQRDDGARGIVPALATDEREALRRLEEAQQAAEAAPVVRDRPGVVTFDGLGPYKYLLRIDDAGARRDRHRDALRLLLGYDGSRHSELVRTLEEYLARRGNVSATAKALYVHPNTLRQRLRRVGELTGLDLRRENWLVIEIALKLLRLEGSTPAAR